MIVKIIVWVAIFFIGSMMLGASALSAVIISLLTAPLAVAYNEYHSKKKKEDLQTTAESNAVNTVDLEKVWKNNFGVKNQEATQEAPTIFMAMTKSKIRRIAVAISAFWIFLGSLLYKSAESFSNWADVIPEFIHGFVRLGYGLGINVFRYNEYDRFSISGFLYFIFFPIALIMCAVLAYEWVESNKSLEEK
jgi:hypothetical protein